MTIFSAYLFLKLEQASKHRNCSKTPATIFFSRMKEARVRNFETLNETLQEARNFAGRDSAKPTKWSNTLKQFGVWEGDLNSKVKYLSICVQMFIRLDEVGNNSYFKWRGSVNKKPKELSSKRRLFILAVNFNVIFIK